MRYLIAGLFFFTALLRADAIDLSQSEKSLYSASGEDGILQALFSSIEPATHSIVEFGAGDGEFGSATRLLRMQDWEGCFFDRSYEAQEHKQYKEFVLAETINELLAAYNVPARFDLLAIGVDYNDYYFWQAMDAKYRPTVVMIQYNATHGPLEDKIVKYRPFFCGDGTEYFGASILSLYRLGRSKGYSLIYADTTGHKLFFLLDEVIQEKKLQFKDCNDVVKLYRKALPYLPDRRNRKYVSSADIDTPP